MTTPIPSEGLTKDEHDALMATRTRPLTQDAVRLRHVATDHQVRNARRAGVDRILTERAELLRPRRAEQAERIEQDGTT